MTRTIGRFALGVACATALVGAANAGGFNRGTADTDILFEEGNFVSRAGVTFVSPTQNVTSVAGGVPSSGDILPDYYIPSVGFKLQITDSAACAGTYTTPFGGNSDYSGFMLGGALLGRDPLSPTGTVSTNFTAHEFGWTCGYSMNAGRGKVTVFGGAFLQHVDYVQTVAALGGATLDLADDGYGYRVGAAYEIPEIALRAQVIYRSAVGISATGNFTLASGTVVNPAATGSATLPQIVEAKLQTGIAPGWLAFASVKWTDWSVFDVLSYNATGAPATLNFYWRDGWTVSGGVAHRFNEQLAGSVGVTWDRGVGTGHDLQSDTWTIGVGGSFTPDKMTEIRAGVGYTYISAVTQNFLDAGVGGLFAPLPGAKVAPAGHSIAGSLSFNKKF
jgi:long-chain fatty acid transport protein